MKKLTYLAFALSSLFAIESIEGYEKKAPYEDYGKPSKVNGIPKTKPISGHIKKNSTGKIIYVNPYGRSKM